MNFTDFDREQNEIIKKYVIDPDFLNISEKFFIKKEEFYFVDKHSLAINEKFCFDSIDEAKNKFVEIIQLKINDLNYAITKYEFLQYRVKNSIDPLYLKDTIIKYLSSIEILLKNTLGIDDE